LNSLAVRSGGYYDGAILFNRSQQHDDHGNSREQITNARQAAEALFAPKRIEPTIREGTPAGEAVRKPRVLAIAAVATVPRDERKAPTSVKLPTMPVIPSAHVARIRAWLKYGMTAAQVVADMYGVAAGEVERFLRIA
jgi:hypothetical protein